MNPVSSIAHSPCIFRLSFSPLLLSSLLISLLLRLSQEARSTRSSIQLAVADSPATTPPALAGDASRHYARPAQYIGRDVAFLAYLLFQCRLRSITLPTLPRSAKNYPTIGGADLSSKVWLVQQPVVDVFSMTSLDLPNLAESLLDLTVERGSATCRYCCLTFRSDFQPPWAGQPQVSIGGLNRGSSATGLAFGSNRSPEQAWPDEVSARIAERTDCVPLVVEELTRAYWRTGCRCSGSLPAYTTH